MPLKNLTLTSPITGFVMERNVFAKQRIMPETALYTMADLSRVWVMADVFEYEAAARPHRHAGHADALLPARAAPSAGA